MTRGRVDFQFRKGRRCVLAILLGACLTWFAAVQTSCAFVVPADATGLGYTNWRVPNIPLSIHVVQVPRSNHLYELHCVHAGSGAVGLDTLSEQVDSVKARLGQPVAAINGDFYQRDRAYAGSPRGLQVIDGELVSGPGNKVTLWIDVSGQAFVGHLSSKFQVTWPDGSSTPFRLNGERTPDRVELYTPAIGRSTRTTGGRELVLERSGTAAWLPLRVGRVCTAVVKEVRQTGDTRMSTNSLVLSIGSAARGVPEVKAGDVLRLSTALDPPLAGVKTAISGGPLLVHNGRRQKFEAGFAESYEYSSMLERHPRAAIGFNQDFFYLVEVDGRQRGLSIGISLDDLASLMVSLGCEEAMNFDGGGSATLWFNGEVQNSPCERAEREIANSLVVIRKKDNL